MKISGKVLSIAGEPLMGVNIFPIKDGKPFEVGGVTDYDGNFNIDLKTLPDDQIVKFSFVGFKPITYKAKELSGKNVIMTDSFEMLDEVIITAPKKEETTLKKLESPARLAIILALIGGFSLVGYILYKNR